MRHHPGSTVAHVGNAYLLSEAGDAAAAREPIIRQRSPATRICRRRIRVLRASSTELGENADEHWQKGFAGHAVVRGVTAGRAGMPLLLLVAAVGGNVPTQHWIDDRAFAVTAVYADFFDVADALPPHAVMVNAIGDADLCGAALATPKDRRPHHSAGDQSAGHGPR